MSDTTGLGITEVGQIPDGEFQGLTEAVETLSADLRSLKRQTHVNRVWRNVLAVLVVVLVVVIADLAYTNKRTEDSLHQNYVTAQQQAQTRVQVLCPLYGLFLGAVQNPSQPAQTSAQKAQLAKDLAIIQKGYKSLGCSPSLPTNP